MAGEKDINLNSLPEGPEKTLQEVIDGNVKLKKQIEKEGSKNKELELEVEAIPQDEPQAEPQVESHDEPQVESPEPLEEPLEDAADIIGSETEVPQKIDGQKMAALQRRLDSDVEGEKVKKVLDRVKKSSIRTYAGDIAALISRGLSISDVAVSEQKKKEKGPEPPPKEARGNKLIAFAAVLFILLGISAGIYALFFTSQDNFKEITEIPSLIFVNDDVELPLNEDLDRIATLRGLNRAREEVRGSLGEVANIYITVTKVIDEETGEEEKRIVGTREFLDKVDISTRASFKRALGDNFMFGVHSFDGNQAFLLFEIEDFENALPGILDWEKLMLDDLWQMFYNQRPETALEEKIDPDAPTTTPSKFFKKGFEDIILKNRDARILEDQEGGAALIYSFPDRGHLIITTDRATLIEVFDRLTTSRVGDI